MAIKFNIQAFYDKRGIDYITKGVNVKKSELNVNCPFCAAEGNPDPSYHLGVDPKTGFWSCWRNRRHRGRRLHRLIMRVGRVSYQEACTILGEFDSYLQEGSFEELARDPARMFDDTPLLKKDPLELPKEFRPLKINYPSAKGFVRYLLSRGFHQNHLQKFIDFYDVHFCIDGIWQNRILLPITLDYELVTWTGRDIAKDSRLRYRSLSEDEGATISIKDTVFNFDDLIETRGNILFVTEGPFDATKIDFYARTVNCRATCLFSKALRDSQSILLSELAMNFKKVIFLLDSSETDTAMLMASSVAYLGDKVETAEVPEPFKDPGEMTPSAIYRFIKTL